MVKLNVIAEIAQGYEGNFELSKLLIKASAKASASIVKFQLVYADDLATPDYKYYNYFKKLEFSFQQWRDLHAYAISLNIQLCFDVFGMKSIEVIEDLGVKFVKIHPTDINNLNLLNRVNKKGYKVFLGIGGAGFSEICRAIDMLTEPDELILIHGYQAYPTPNDFNQISRISYLSKKLTQYSSLKFGFADHNEDDYTQSVLLNSMAYVAGASYFEKHLSLGKCLQLEDFESALQPDEFKKFVDCLKNAVEAYGSVKDLEYFGMSEQEETYRLNIRRSWVASRDLNVGVVLSENDIDFKRTGDNSRCELFSELIGSKLKKQVLKYNRFKDDDFE